MESFFGTLLAKADFENENQNQNGIENENQNHLVSRM